MYTAQALLVLGKLDVHDLVVIFDFKLLTGCLIRSNHLHVPWHIYRALCVHVLVELLDFGLVFAHVAVVSALARMQL